MTVTAYAAPPFTARLLAPRHWPSWLGVALLWCVAQLPLPVGRVLGRALGRMAGRIVRSRRRVVEVNLRVCFPQMSEDERRRLVDEHFEAAGEGVIEATWAWFASDRRLAPHFGIEGREHLDAAVASGRGLLLLTAHFTTLEIGARLVRTLTGLPFHAMYRPYANPVMDWCMHRWRQSRSGLPALPRDDLRRLVRSLREGRAIWYAPDQTLDPRLSVFAPFFGVPTLTLTATARLSQMGRAGVLPYFPRRENGRWIVRFEPMLEGFPSGDDLADATRINAVIEAGVLRALPQYFWMHRRFKKRPPGEPPLY